jgi:hypothetical protein
MLWGSCEGEGFEDQLLALFTAIEASQNQNGVGSVLDLSVSGRS